uniref:Uncharacterized protein n=1 Tax=Chenopodium quinoa TaxID=63459 RepID=A0A803L165_CHEQI
MAATSFSLLRHHAPPHLTSSSTAALFLRRRFSLLTTSIVCRNTHDKSKQAQSNALKEARETTRTKHTQSSSLSSLSNSHILSPNQAIGMVASAQANFMRVIVQSTPPEEPSRTEVLEGSGRGAGIELLCVVRAVLKKIKRRVLVGDRVLVGSIDWVDRRGMIENVFPRESEIPDPPIANADHFLVVFSLDQPKVEPYSLTRFLVEAESTGFPLTLALNKCELVRDESWGKFTEKQNLNELAALRLFPSAAYCFVLGLMVLGDNVSSSIICFICTVQVLIEWKTRLRQWGYAPIFCSVESKRGLDSLAFYLRDRTTVIVGPSGVGKSSLINALRSNGQSPNLMEEGSLFDPNSGSKWFEEQRVGEVSTRSGRGKHTTRNVSLLPLAGGGYLADTPGFSQPSLMKVTKHTLAQAFPEIRKKLEENKPNGCAFNNCLHVGEPGCVVTGDWERDPYYFQLLDEIKAREEFQLRTLSTKREGDVRNKVGDMGITLAEPRLEPKKHRRQSRKKMNQSLLDELDELDDDDDEYLEDNPIIRAMEQENQ